ncbi:MAG: Rad52/Rad22 family DNA repair protein [Synechococcaceae cyanobacterium]
MAALAAPLDRANVRQREQGRAKMADLEGWQLIAEANRIFGFDGWQRQTIAVRCVAQGERTIGRDQKPGWGVTITLGLALYDKQQREATGASWAPNSSGRPPARLATAPPPTGRPPHPSQQLPNRLRFLCRRTPSSSCPAPCAACPGRCSTRSPRVSGGGSRCRRAPSPSQIGSPSSALTTGLRRFWCRTGRCARQTRTGRCARQTRTGRCARQPPTRAADCCAPEPMLGFQGTLPTVDPWPSPGSVTIPP